MPVKVKKAWTIIDKRGNLYGVGWVFSSKKKAQGYFSKLHGEKVVRVTLTWKT